ncbi:MAG: DUF4127 family protein [Eubacterium sp.]|nr:DUF4127 family protein [Eubacterium sp.]
MKKKFALLITTALTFLMMTETFGASVFTAPIDSRPVSTDYLERLSAVSGDSFVCVSDDSLDFFSGKTDLDHNGNSAAVREQIYKMAEENSSSDSTFIINMTSYLTGGLVGSRSGENYKDLNEAVESLEKLMTDFPEPNYYINISMPRTLPDTHFGEIWTDEKTYSGLGSFYLKANPDSGRAYEIASSYSRVTASQLLLEWSYVKNHKAMGEISDWEEAFLKYFNKNFETKDPYKQYLSSYRAPYSAVSQVGAKLMKLYKQGLDFELIITEDDFQLPDFIIYLNDESLLSDELKYSYALNYMETYLYGEAKDTYGVTELENALKGKGNHLNFIFGTDEAPQLIYARDLSKRTGLIPNLFLKNDATSSSVAKFDVKTSDELLSSAINFVSAGTRRTTEETDLFIFDYADAGSYDLFINKMENAYNQGNSVALMELYTTAETTTGNNYLFKLLCDRSRENYSFGFHSLCAYSAWNTTANAIGLGVAHAAVYSINKELNNSKDFVKANLQMLITHGSEDGVYNCDIKRNLYGYYPYWDENNKDKLASLFEEYTITDCFDNKTYETSDGELTVKTADVTDCYFPWLRTFECCFDVALEAE